MGLMANWHAVGNATLGVLGLSVLAALVAALVATATTSYWETRKLARAERLRAYADYLAADSERWAAFKDRDRVKDARDSEEFRYATAQIRGARDRMWLAYAQAQVSGDATVVKAMLRCIRLSDDRQAAFFSRERKAPGDDTRKAALGVLVTAARADLNLRPLPRGTFDKD